ncbi:SMI1/KNR4 family protein [Massilia sp. CF038]|uniref:SMI1/KNR4 family protein n=1 Tax=Massilia sp. CF038 TaxID=1881045 RepID=UPI00091246BD|nr:SMI1/KNR4 family protein [Massilia sp. CF038]SHG45491.1 SMI1 / KNR4 family (SUKH-1) [Massilia sp. CF038]
MKINHLTALEQINSPASAQLIAALETELKRPLPIQYRQLLLTANGMIFENGLVLYSTDDVVERNETFEVGTYAPGYLAVGDDSGGKAVMIAIETQGVFMVGMGSMDPDDMIQISDCLESWVTDGFPMPEQ